MKAFCVAGVLSAALASAADAGPAHQATHLALLCIKKGEETSGLNKICYYDCAGSAAAITVKAYELCPLNPDR